MNSEDIPHVGQAKEASPKEHSRLRNLTDAAILDTVMTALETTPQVTYREALKGVDRKPQEKEIVKAGQRIGRWKIISAQYHTPANSKPVLLLRCDCGEIRTLPSAIVTSGKSTSCGCDR